MILDNMVMNIDIPDLLDEKGMIKEEYTADGSDINPRMEWSDFPEDTEFFAVYCHDPDAPVGDWIHWIVINIPKNLTKIPKDGPVPGEQVVNDFGKKDYGGPAPPSGTHNYFFSVYALSKKLEDVDKNNFLDKVNEASVDEAKIMGKYSR